MIIEILLIYDYRSNALLANAVQMSANIYEKQYQIAGFVKRFYNGREIAVNDVGAVGFFDDIKMTDLYGLADYEVLELKRKNYSADDLRYLAHTRNFKISILFSNGLLLTEKAYFDKMGKSSE